MGANQSNGSSASIRLPDNENEQSDLLNNSLDQIDEPDEVVISGTSEQNEIEKLEAQLVELSSQHDDHSTELQNLMDEDILQEYIFDYSFNGIKATHLIVILDALFLFIRLVFMADVFVILALFELISLILMVVGYKREQHFFFWPFVLGCYFEMIVAVFQVAAICWVTLMHREPEWLAEGFDIVLFPVLAEQLNTSFGIFKIFFFT
ncbi:hypothetical protein M3Y94_00417100 [Aphelenchoides besseyi]|nr:hypothetical protein M3Y94_00417100 [Aphelenchoides besseyi]